MMRPNGFTLIELLVAMTAGMLLLVGLSWAMSRLSHQLKSSSASNELERLLAIEDQLVRLVGGARASEPEAVSLSARRVRLITNPPASMGPIGLVDAELSVIGGTDNQSLNLDMRAQNNAQRSDRQSSQLLTGMKSIRFHWLNDEPLGDAAAPAIVIEIVPRSGDLVRVVAPLHVTGDATCEFDPISLACR